MIFEAKSDIEKYMKMAQESEETGLGLDPAMIEQSGANK